MISIVSSGQKSIFAINLKKAQTLSRHDRHEIDKFFTIFALYLRLCHYSCTLARQITPQHYPYWSSTNEAKLKLSSKTLPVITLLVSQSLNLTWQVEFPKCKEIKRKKRTKSIVTATYLELIDGLTSNRCHFYGCFRTNPLINCVTKIIKKWTTK